MKNSPFFSIIIPNYNGEKYLDECLESICAQTFTNFEVIIIDDGSTDDSVLICKRYEEQDFRFNVIQQKNSGPNEARKRGLYYAKGVYAVFVDSDDWIEDNTLEFFYDRLNREKFDVLIFGFYQNFEKEVVYLKNNIPNGSYRNEEIQSLCSQLICTKYFNVGVWPSMWSKVFKIEKARSVIDRVDNRLSYGEDAAFSYLYIAESKSAFVTEEAFYHYRDVENTLSKRVDSNFWEKLLILFEWFDNNLEMLPKKQLECYKVRNLEVSIMKLLFQEQNIFQNISKIKKILKCEYYKQIISNANIKDMDYSCKYVFWALKYDMYIILYMICFVRKIKKMIQ